MIGNTQKTVRVACVALVLLSALADSAGAVDDEIPAMSMHIFEDDSHWVEPARPMPQTVAADDTASFQMVVFADEAEPNEPGLGEPVAEAEENGDFSFFYELSSGYQRDEISWNVAAPTPSGSPNPALETEWNGIDLWRLNGRFDVETPIGVIVKGNAVYGRVLDGSVEQSAYLGNDRTLPYAQTRGDSDEGYILGGSIGAGYRFETGNQHVRAALTPVGGYAAYRQRLALKDNSGSRYTAEWKGPWLGMDGSVSWLGAHELFASFEHHWADYDADISGGQNSGFAQPLSFKHSADATGWKGLLGYRYRFAELMGVSLTFDYQKWNSDPGSEQGYLANGVTVNSTLNKVTRESMGVNFGVNMKF